jgi:hypothetical protein
VQKSTVEGISETPELDPKNSTQKSLDLPSDPV